jgi:hypothetical protein
MGIKNSNINNASSSSRNPEKGTEGKSHDQSCDSFVNENNICIEDVYTKDVTG